MLPFVLRSSGMAGMVGFTVPNTLLANTVWKTSGLRSATAPRMETPTLFTSRSSRPKVATASSINRRPSSESLTSPQTTCTRDVCSSTAAFAEARRSWFLPFKTTAAPRWAQAMAMALPMPRLDPVTTTTLSVRSGRRGDEVVMCRVDSGCQDDASTRSSCWSTPWPRAPKTQSKWFPTPR